MEKLQYWVIYILPFHAIMSGADTDGFFSEWLTPVNVPMDREYVGIVLTRGQSLTSEAHFSEKWRKMIHGHLELSVGSWNVSEQITRGLWPRIGSHVARQKIETLTRGWQLTLICTTEHHRVGIFIETDQVICVSLIKININFRQILFVYEWKHKTDCKSNAGAKNLVHRFI